MPLAPKPLEALNPKTEKFLIVTAMLYFEPLSFEIYQQYIFVGTGPDLSFLWYETSIDPDFSLRRNDSLRSNSRSVPFEEGRWMLNYNYETITSTTVVTIAPSP